MSEPTPAPPTHEGLPATDTNPQPAPAQEIDWKAKAREWESRAKANKTAADELASIRESQKSEAEKVAERLATAEQKVAHAEARALRRDVALDFKLSKDDADLLDTMTDEAAMRALAGRLAQVDTDRKKTGNHVPREGNTPAAGKAGEGLEAVRSLFGGTD